MAKIRTRARAVDMLGRQQIATIQNAISELFKNAHDAYATEVRLDYFEDSGHKSQARQRSDRFTPYRHSSNGLGQSPPCIRLA